ncbi:hypothetical protein BOO86_18540 [Mycobacterium sp. CBMA 234]|nr:hypothetical protein [Mycolicibacterium sp. CBMA 234]
MMPTKLAAAGLTAGVIAAGLSIGAAEHVRPTIEVNVANTSAITDVLDRAGWFVDGVAIGAALSFDAVVSLPFDALTVIAITVEHPNFAPSALSWLVNRYVNPADEASYPYYTYPWDFKTNAVANIAYALPYPLGPSATAPGLINGLADGLANIIGHALAGLPDATDGVDATDAYWGTFNGAMLKSVNNALVAPAWGLRDVASYVGFLPSNVVATIEAAMKSPQNVPGLVSNLVYDLLGSADQYGLAGYLVRDLGHPFTTLPGPVGQFSTNLVANIQHGLENLLANLPTPISPTPVAEKKAAGAMPTAAVHGVGAGDIPAINGPSANVVTLTVSDTPDVPKAPETSKVAEAPKAPEAPKVVETPKAAETPKALDIPKAVETPKAPEGKPAAQGDATGTGTPAAGPSATGHDGGDNAAAGTAGKSDKPAEKVKSDKKIKSGNKVQPGTKSTKGQPDKSTTPGGADKPSTSEGADKPAGSGHSDSSGSGSGSDHSGAAA